MRSLLRTVVNPVRAAVVFTMALAVTIVAAQVASARTIPAIGARGDRTFSDRCPTGSYILGFRIRSGSWVDQIGIICRDPAAASPGVHNGPAQGGNGGGPSTGRCPTHHVLSGMTLQHTKGNRQVANIDARCQHVHRPTTTPVRFVRSPGASSPFNSVSCPSGEAAVGLIGNVGAHVNALGLICEPLVVRKNPPKYGVPPPKGSAPNPK